MTIRFDYENHCTTTATVDGKEETLYVPFAALTGMLLDNERFTNIEVTNGRVVNDGSHRTPSSARCRTAILRRSTT